MARASRPDRLPDVVASSKYCRAGGVGLGGDLAERLGAEQQRAFLFGNPGGIARRMLDQLQQRFHRTRVGELQQQRHDIVATREVRFDEQRQELGPPVGPDCAGRDILADPVEVRRQGRPANAFSRGFAAARPATRRSLRGDRGHGEQHEDGQGSQLGRCVHHGEDTTWGAWTIKSMR